MRRLPAPALASLLLLSAFGSACGGGGEDARELEDAVLAAAAAYTDEDLDAFRAAFTDDGITELFQIDSEDLDAFLEFLPDLLGEEPPVITSFANTRLSGDNGSTEATTEQTGVVVVDRYHLVRENDEWIIDGVDHSVATPDLDGYSTTILGMDESSFELNADELSPGEVAFQMENAGEQPHEALLVSLEDDVDLDEAIMSVEQPEGVDIIADVQVEPGESRHMALADELEAGRYAFICFLPDRDDPAGTPHAFLGMTADFRIE